MLFLTRRKRLSYWYDELTRRMELRNAAIKKRDRAAYLAACDAVDVARAHIDFLEGKT